MSRRFAERVERLGKSWANGGREQGRASLIERTIAVTTEQVIDHSLPTSPDDPDAMQAEALPPDVLALIVREACENALDLDAIERVRRSEKRERAALQKRVDKL